MVSVGQPNEDTPTWSGIAAQSRRSVGRVCVGRGRVCVGGESVCVGVGGVFQPEVSDRDVQWDQHMISFLTLFGIQFELQNKEGKSLGGVIM